MSGLNPFVKNDFKPILNIQKGKRVRSNHSRGQVFIKEKLPSERYIVLV